MTSYMIEQKMSGTGSIHDIASDQYDREVVFGRGCRYAVVLASYYGGKGYTTHRTAEATIKASHRVREYSHVILDTAGREYSVDGDTLRMEQGQ